MEDTTTESERKLYVPVNKSEYNVKQVLVSILVGACVAFFSTLFAGIAEFIQQHGTEVLSGAISSAVYLAKAYKG